MRRLFAMAALAAGLVGSATVPAAAQHWNHWDRGWGGGGGFGLSIGVGSPGYYAPDAYAYSGGCTCPGTAAYGYSTGAYAYEPGYDYGYAGTGYAYSPGYSYAYSPGYAYGSYGYSNGGGWWGGSRTRARADFRDDSRVSIRTRGAIRERSTMRERNAGISQRVRGDTSTRSSLRARASVRSNGAMNNTRMRANTETRGSATVGRGGAELRGSGSVGGRGGRQGDQESGAGMMRR